MFLNNIRVYAKDGVQRLRRDELRAAVETLADLFCQVPPAPGTVSEWSAAAATAGHLAGFLYVVEGGQGEMGMRIITHVAGIFRCT